MTEKRFFDTEVVELFEAIDQYIAGEIDKVAIKHASSKFGIYRQNDDSFMVRVRITGGNVSIPQLQVLSEVAKKFECNFFHLSTRQTIQIQGIPITQLKSVVSEITECGLFFRGGGGNTYRNTACSPESSFAADAVFDVQPYAAQVQDFVFALDTAYTLPRKFKIALSCSDRDTAMASMQDLGFIATLDETGAQGFKVYLGGGMGRASKISLKVIDFLPVAEMLKIVKATINFFHACGNREKRHLARMRHLRTTLGDEEFVALFNKYVAEVEVVSEISTPELVEVPFGLETESVPDSKDFELWLTRAVKPHGTHDDESSVDLFLPFGNLDPKEFIDFVDYLSITGLSNLILTAQQNFIIPRIKNSALPTLYSFLTGFRVDMTGRSFSGLMQACIGSQACTLGLVDTPRFAELSGLALDDYYSSRQEEQAELCKEIIESIRFSGCQNTCSAHIVAELGFQGVMRTGEDGTLRPKFAVFHGGKVSAEDTTLAIREGGFITTENASKEVIKLIQNRLKK
ncbi:MAG: nitrite/sulfite reductase [Lentisphaeria bacterium]|nr:nitrite/sulfite reductase [Lentisphaeria bacterium]